MATPKDKKGIKSLLGVIKYFGKYIPHVSQKTAVLRELTKDNVLFEWNSQHMQAWNELNADLAGAPVLALFDPNMKTKFAANASSFRTGEAVM